MKKNFPIEFIRTLEDIKEQNRDIIEAQFQGKDTIILKDKDIASNFSFTIRLVDADGGDTSTYSLSAVPASREHLTEEFTFKYSVIEIKKDIDFWIHLIKEYNKPSSLFDDPITQHYYEELNPYFEILDEDADQKPFPMLQQQLLTNYYELLIEEVIKNKDEENAAEADAVVIELKQAQKAVSKSTKKTVIRTLQRNIAKLWKFSAQVGAKAIASLTEEGVKEALKTAGLKAAEIAMKLLG